MRMIGSPRNAVALVLSGIVAMSAFDLSGAVSWFNTPPIKVESLRGKVVLVDIWTYSCINSLRQLPYIMAISRFAHYLKAMMRDKIGSFMSREQAESFLNRWIINYVTPDDSASQDTKAKRPLREARIEVTEVSGKPGVYRAVAFLRPHFQLDELTVSLRLVAELPAPAK